MTFQYYGGGQNQLALQGLQYQQAQPQQQQQSGMDMGSMMGMAGEFMGGGEGGGGITGMFGGGGGGGSAVAGNLAASEGIGSAGTIGGGGWGGAAGGGSSAASGGSTLGSAASSAGPWAALAAIIVSNEYNARGGGYRSEDNMQYAQDVFSGEVLGQDIEKRWLPKIGIEEGSDENKWISHLIHPVSADLEESWSSFKDLF